MKRRVEQTAASVEGVRHAAGQRILLAIKARREDPNRLPLDIEVSFVPSSADVQRVQELQRRRNEI